MSEEKTKQEQETPKPEAEKVAVAAEVLDKDVAQEEESKEDKPKEVSKAHSRFSNAPDLDAWKPKTYLGKKVKKGDVADIDVVLDSGAKILEFQIVDTLMPTADSDLLLIGQSKGKFGGGQRRVFRQTQKKTKEGNKPSFATYAVFGDRKGHVGLGYGKARETVPAREKAVTKAKLAVLKIRRGCGSWQCNCSEPHSIPFKVSGKCGSVVIDIIPAPKGTGLVTETEVKKILALAGVEDAWSSTRGKTTSRINLIKATLAALKQLTSTKIQERHVGELNVSE